MIKFQSVLTGSLVSPSQNVSSYHGPYSQQTHHHGYKVDQLVAGLQEEPGKHHQHWDHKAVQQLKHNDKTMTNQHFVYWQTDSFSVKREYSKAKHLTTEKFDILPLILTSGCRQINILLPAQILANKSMSNYLTIVWSLNVLFCSTNTLKLKYIQFTTIELSKSHFDSRNNYNKY